MAWFRLGGAGISAALKNAMNAVLNKKLGTSQEYAPNSWPEEVNLLGALEEKTASGSIVTFSDGADDVPISSGIFGIVPRGGGGTPSSPVAISGHTGMTISHAGKNSLDTANAETKSSNSVSVTCDGSGKYTATGTATGGSANITFTLKTPCEIKSGMYLHLMSSPANANVSLTIQKQDNTSIYSPTLSPANRIIDLSSYVGETIYSIRFYVVNGASSELTFSPMLCYSNTATTFEPYKAPETLAVSWQDEAGTVYGGNLNVTTGVLTVWGKMYTIDGTQSVTMLTTTNPDVKRFSVSIPNDSITTTADDEDIYCDMLPTSTNASVSAGNMGIHYRLNGSHNIILCFGTSVALTSETEYNTYVSEHNLTIVYKLATPTTYQLTAHELSTFLGANNFYCDTGDTEVVYRASGTVTPITPTLISKTITANGTYTASDDGADGYDEVVVNVSTAVSADPIMSLNAFVTKSGVSGTNTSTVARSFTMSAAGKLIFASGTYGFTNTGSNEGFFEIQKNGVSVVKQYCNTSTNTPITIPEISVEENDVVDLVVGFDNQHSNCNFQFYSAMVVVSEV